MSGVLISGVTTPLGRYLAQHIASQRHRRILGLGLEPEERVRPHLPRGVHYHRIDITRPRHVRQVLFGPARALDITTVYHLALHRSATDVGPRVHRLNVDATRLLLRLAEDHPTVRRFVMCSSGAAYRRRTDTPDLIREDQPVDLSANAPQWIRDRVEADVTVCARMGLSSLHINVLRCAEIFTHDMGSQLWDYLGSRVCFRPMGFDPIVNLLTVEDAARALTLSLDADEPGVINIPGADTLPLSRLIRLWGRDDIPVPGPLLGPMYRARSLLRGSQFHYALNVRRFHYNTVLDGTRAERLLGYRPQVPITWPCPEPAA